MLSRWCVVKRMLVRPEYRTNEHLPAALLQPAKVRSR
jgi:hypothetical protein